MTEKQPANIHEAILAVYERVGYVPKKGKVDLGKTSYKFAGEAEFIAAIRPAMIEAGVYQQPVKIDVITNDRVDIEREWQGKITKSFQHRVVIVSMYRFTHAATNSYVDVPAIGEAMDSGDKAFNKAMTAANKYAVRQLFMIETGDDPDKYASKEEGGVDDKPADDMVTEGNHDKNYKGNFANDSLRNTYCKNAVSALERCESESALRTAFEQYWPKLQNLQASPNARDRMAAEEIIKAKNRQKAFIQQHQGRQSRNATRLQ